MRDPSDLHVHLVQMPPGTPPGFPVTQFLGQQRSELDVPWPEGLMADVDPALVEQFLNGTLTEREAMVEPQGVLDDAEEKTVAAGASGHSRLTSLSALSCQNPPA
ncbi:hypothetical protein GCM10008949_23220 [Deinococcus humi]|nr:hypothetical protein GCM10008949_23220 [Deinococcus humi]